jgi:hypothetical protein
MNIVELALYREDEENPTKVDWEVTLVGNVKYVGRIENLYNDQFKINISPDVYFAADKVVCLSRA